MVNAGISNSPDFRGINTVVQVVVRVVLKFTMLVCELTDVLPTIKSPSRAEVSNALLSTSSSAVTVNMSDSLTTTGFLSTLALILVNA